MGKVLKAPMVWFGGKSTVADVVWDRLGDVDNYCEPFAGSAAVLLRRPDRHRGNVETINDKYHHIVNVWRALRADPDAVAEHADWIVSEADLHARHKWLVHSDRAKEVRANVTADPDYFDAKTAGWWLWGSACWIGSGWCTPDELRVDGNHREKMIDTDGGRRPGRPRKAFGPAPHANCQFAWGAGRHETGRTRRPDRRSGRRVRQRERRRTPPGPSPD